VRKVDFSDVTSSQLAKSLIYGSTTELILRLALHILPSSFCCTSQVCATYQPPVVLAMTAGEASPNATNLPWVSISCFLKRINVWLKSKKIAPRTWISQGNHATFQKAVRQYSTIDLGPRFRSQQTNSLIST
jgi:hypothetical protein